jgi:hypothetical protein
MEDKDHLKEILGNIDQVNEPIDLETVILKAMQAQKRSKVQIARYISNGKKALIVSSMLIVVLAILFSLPNSVRTVKHSIVTYTSIILILLVLFIQLEMGRTKIFNNLKNNLL